MISVQGGRRPFKNSISQCEQSTSTTTATTNSRVFLILLYQVFVLFGVVAQVWVSTRLTQSGSQERHQLGQDRDHTTANHENCTHSSCSASRSSQSPTLFSPIPTISKNASFGACLLVKGDNDLLMEWIPYHYTTLPLRYLFVASDVGNLEDPSDVLKLWTHANTGLQSWVVNASVFENLHGKYHVDRKKQADSRNDASFNQTTDPTLLHQIAHGRLVHKQRAFITHCANFMRQQGVRWVTFHDSDEFLVIHRIGLDEISKEGGQQELTLNQTESKNQLLDAKFGLRRHLPSIESNATVVDVIHGLQHIHLPLKSCQTIPRISVGALENFTCPGVEPIIAFAKANFRFDVLSTLRFQQHAKKDDFGKNRFGKVFLDVQNMSESSMSSRPKNIHRPFAEECIRAIVDVWTSPFYFMHYVGSWERYSSRSDDRRTIESWKKHAFLNDSTACCAEEVHRWLPRFVDQVGLDRAKFLLGVRTEVDSSTRMLV
jgi:hypothetical protein